MTKGKPFETNLNRPTWMVQLWFQWYFFKLWVPNLEFPKGVAPTRIMADVSPTNHFTFSYLYFFRVCRTPENLEWGALVLRRQLGFKQAILVPFFDLVDCGTSYWFRSP
ncbi:hypothetical protein COP1_006839 [Malus domestica]